MVHVLDHSTFHSFVRTHPLAVILVQISDDLEFAVDIAEHFERNFAGRVPCATVSLSGSGGARWFNSFLDRSRLPTPTGDGTYYLFIDGCPAASHQGVPPDAAANSLMGGLLAVALKDRSFFEGMKFAKLRAREQGAAEVISHFETSLPREPRLTPAGEDEDDFALLEIEPTAPLAEAETAFRKLMAEFHPDNVRRAGGLRDLAEQRSKSLSAAISRIREGKPRRR